MIEVEPTTTLSEVQKLIRERFALTTLGTFRVMSTLFRFLFQLKILTQIYKEHTFEMSTNKDDSCHVNNSNEMLLFVGVVVVVIVKDMG